MKTAARITTLLVLSCFTLLRAFGQNPAEKVAPPFPPFLLSYHYWPGLFIQWVGNELPYSMIQVYADRDGASPVYDVVLTERPSGKRIHYANEQALVDQAKRSGDDAYLTKIDRKVSNEASSQGTYEFSFTDHGGNPVLWRYIQGSDVTEQGSGLTPIPGASALVLMYREAGATAAEGTALQIGRQVSEAELWKEISSPPYYLPYRGARTVGLDLATLYSGNLRWKVESTPSSLTQGQGWMLSDQTTRHLHLTIEKIVGTEYQIVLEDNAAPSIKTHLTLKRLGEVWELERVRYESEVQGDLHGISLSFQPALPLGDADGKSIRFEVQMAKNTRIGSGTISMTKTGGGLQYIWQFKSPDWARTRSMTTTLSAAPDAIDVRQILK